MVRIFCKSLGDGNILAIGAYGNDENGADAGQTKIYEWNGTAWNQNGLSILGDNAGDWFGFSVSISDNGSVLAIGAHMNSDNGFQSGHTRVYNNITLSIEKNDFEDLISSYPNPTDNNFFIDLGATYQNVKVRMTDINGK